VLPEKDAHDGAGAREIADHLVACTGSMLCYWYHFSHNGQRIHVETDDDFVIMARSDALASHGFDEMLARLVACVEAGADAVFPEAITDLAMYRKVKDAVKVPVLANITEFGKTPLYTRDELGAAGVDIVLHCCSAYRAMNLAALKVFQAIRRDGTQKNVVGDMQTRDDLYKYLDYHAYERKLDALFSSEKEKSR
jgi:methylisocitrate lyase